MYDATVIDEDRTLPAVLVEAHSLEFFEDHDGYDFQPDDEFDSVTETTHWWRAWTGDPAATTPPFRVFGRDGTGGLAAIWSRGPIVFLGSEGELAVIARDLGDYLWLLANGVGPLERVDGVDRDPEPIPALVDLAQRFTGDGARSLEAVYAAADAELPALTALVNAAIS
ncbi:hypothetical protein GCM10010435_56120 [Winogradskya consettensis]|uniref:SMI1/KNR4 family protein n=1 Tax=Winogradskya consettensis TaxID=113560 RepID=A0A919S812_9ACTN|nr:hypothetical protein Aco04nite_06200 [Actinoplanes consettensis]